MMLRPKDVPMERPLRRFVWVRTVSVKEQHPGSKATVWDVEATGSARHEDCDRIILGGTGECPFHVGERITLTMQTGPE